MPAPAPSGAVIPTIQYRFEVTGKPEDTFSVVRFSGTERLSQLYHFDIELVSEKPLQNKEFTNLLHAGCRLVFCWDGKPIKHYHGLLASWCQLPSPCRGLYHYQVQLVPRLGLLGESIQSRVFLDQSVTDMIEAILTDQQITQGEIDYSLALTGSYPKKAMSCKYNESTLDHLLRRLEHWGLWFTFDQSSDQREALIISDNPQAHQPIAWPEDSTLSYTGISQPDNDKSDQPPHQDNNSSSNARLGKIIDQWRCHFEPLPQSVLLKDHNYEKPQLALEGRATVDTNGRGEYYCYGEHFDTRAEGNQLAKVRAEALRCQAQVYHGSSDALGLQAGSWFILTDQHTDQAAAAQQRYLVTEVTHSGNQAAAIAQQFGWRLRDNSPVYRNQFQCINHETPYRPDKTITVPKCTGVLLAHIDAASSGKYAELDSQGRYKVILPFDLSGRADGKASCWLPLAVPYAGSNHGMHFPLHKGATVLLGCIDGNVDRWVIQAALTNQQNPSVVNDQNQTSSVIKTPTSSLELKDIERPEIKVASGVSSITVRGSGRSYDHKHKPGVHLFCPTGTLNSAAYKNTSVVFGKSIDVRCGAVQSTFLDKTTGVYLGLGIDFALAAQQLVNTKSSTSINTLKVEMGLNKNQVQNKDTKVTAANITVGISDVSAIVSQLKAVLQSTQLMLQQTNLALQSSTISLQSTECALQKTTVSLFSLERQMTQMMTGLLRLGLIGVNVESNKVRIVNAGVSIENSALSIMTGPLVMFI